MRLSENCSFCLLHIHFSFSMLFTASVIFADISGFSAWSSSREPHQVFSYVLRQQRFIVRE